MAKYLGHMSSSLKIIVHTHTNTHNQDSVLYLSQ